MESKRNRSLLHSKLKRKRMSKEKGLWHFTKEQFIRLLVFGVPLASLAFWGNCQLNSRDARERAFLRSQDMWNAVNSEFQSAFTETKILSKRIEGLCDEYLTYSSALTTASERDGVTEADTADIRELIDDVRSRSLETMYEFDEACNRLEQSLFQAMIHGDIQHRNLLERDTNVMVTWIYDLSTNYKYAAQSIFLDIPDLVSEYIELGKGLPDPSIVYYLITMQLLNQDYQPDPEIEATIAKAKELGEYLRSHADPASDTDSATGILELDTSTLPDSPPME